MFLQRQEAELMDTTGEAGNLDGIIGCVFILL